MFFIQVLQVDFLADFQFTLVYTGLLFLPPDVSQYMSWVFVDLFLLLFSDACQMKNHKLLNNFHDIAFEAKPTAVRFPWDNGRAASSWMASTCLSKST